MLTRLLVVAVSLGIVGGASASPIYYTDRDAWMAAVAAPPQTGGFTLVTLDQTGSYPDFCAAGAWHQGGPESDVYCTLTYDGLVEAKIDYTFVGSVGPSSISYTLLSGSVTTLDPVFAFGMDIAVYPYNATFPGMLVGQTFFGVVDNSPFIGAFNYSPAMGIVSVENVYIQRVPEPSTSTALLLSLGLPLMYAAHRCVRRRTS